MFSVFSHPGYFGKVGMRVFHLNAAANYCPTINIDKLWTLVPKETRDILSKDKAPVIDCVRAVSSFVLFCSNTHVSCICWSTVRLQSTFSQTIRGPKSTSVIYQNDEVD